MIYRNICFTINNYNESDWTNICKCGLFSYLVAGRECGESGTKHYQGYGELIKRTRINTIKINMPRAHIEERRGTQQQAITYCMKDGDYMEWGNKREQGARTDLDKLRCGELNEKPMRELTRTCNAQQIRVAEKYMTYNETARNWKIHVIWLWGETGAGKSKRAREICTDDVYTKNSGTKWWDGYDAHKNVIIDDFRDSWWSLTEMLSLLDRYEKLVEYKGGWRQFKPYTIVVTSITKPEYIYKGCGEDIRQLLRRIDEEIWVVPNVPEVV